jgi:hypothetical protein
MNRGNHKLLAISAVVILIMAFGVLPAQGADCTYATTNHTIKGTCPPGKASSGACEIKESDKGFRLTLVTGSVCQPASMCVFFCQRSGDTVNCTNTDKVDDEGGMVTNKMNLKIGESGQAAGTGSSVYNHPGGFTCTWGYRVSVEADYFK